MNFKRVIAAGFAAALATSGIHAAESDDRDPASLPSFAASEHFETTATVVSVDHDSRWVTLRGEDGREISFEASDEVRNLDQVEAGDVLTVEVFGEVTIQLLPGDGSEAGAGAAAMADRAELGDKPGAVIAGREIITATVEAINLEKNTYILKGPKGNLREFEAINPENLKLARVGDLVVVTTTTAVGMFVDTPEAE